MELEAALADDVCRRRGSTTTACSCGAAAKRGPNTLRARGRLSKPASQAVMTHGGFGYAKEYHVERLSAGDPDFPRIRSDQPAN